MAGPQLDPTSFAYQEGVEGQPPQVLDFGVVRFWGVDGVPSASLGANGDFAFNKSGAAGASTTIYHKEAGTWVGLTA
jgi:hypothetical protein